MNPPVALTIAGSDSGGGAGIQADLKTFAAHEVFGTSVITALTAQNTAGVRAISAVDPGFVEAQLEAVLDDLPVAGVKTGMLANPDTVALVARLAPRLPNLVVDPVLVASSGDRLFTADAERAYLELLFPHAAVVTPNLREASVLLGREVLDADDAAKAAGDLAAYGPRCVVVKGGHLRGSAEAVDAVWYDGHTSLLSAPWIDTTNNHGTGCTFAAATAARLAAGDELPVALARAKSYVHSALTRSASWTLGAGHGPLAWGPF
ncbi:bifunctional hydroxymethylpyrimidine kinase/phosphomethylpyrimidine kinase [Dactylosporangium sp. NPDC000244]|uniref:bifunctional hydroxymethylpyrimidine kinase/phosphomethylpyrimidine kinase n=1 Tax=Dactylosporangium sp. NPDC000244 TaxID=3154365 RepID=UPI0033308F86